MKWIIERDKEPRYFNKRKSTRGKNIISWKVDRSNATNFEDKVLGLDQLSSLRENSKENYYLIPVVDIYIEKQERN